MTALLELRPEAVADITSSFLYYESQRLGLGQAFEEELGHVLDLLLEMPEMGPVAYRQLRRILLKRFPFAIYYRTDTIVVEVRGVIHTSQAASQWRGRA